MLAVAPASVAPRPALVAPLSNMRLAAEPATGLFVERTFQPPASSQQTTSKWSAIKVRASDVGDAMHHHSIITFALLILLVGSSGTIVAGKYLSTAADTSYRTSAAELPQKPTIAGLNIIVPAAKYQSKLQAVTSQKIRLTVGDQTVVVEAATIQSWLQAQPTTDYAKYYVQVNSKAVTSSIMSAAQQIAATSNSKISDPSSLETQAHKLAMNLTDAKGFWITAPLTN